MKHLLFILTTTFFLYSPFIISNPTAHAGTIQLPQTGQTTCYNSSGAVIGCAGTGQDGNLRAGAAWPNHRFVVSGECVTDNLTGLMWARNGNLAGQKDWYQALDWVAALNSGDGLCGYRDWRLPNLNELESMVNEEKANISDWLNTQGFYSVQASEYWSSSTNANLTSYAWAVYIFDGHVSYYNKTDYGNYVWPVRSGQ
jgi:hypothetical protein